MEWADGASLTSRRHVNATRLVGVLEQAGHGHKGAIMACSPKWVKCYVYTD